MRPRGRHVGAPLPPRAVEERMARRRAAYGWRGRHVAPCPGCGTTRCRLWPVVTGGVNAHLVLSIVEVVTP